MLPLPTLITISRPRFWLYTAWSFLVWIAASGYFWTIIQMHQQWAMSPIWWMFFGVVMLMFLYFLFPANLLIYGVNDIADQDTDAFNDKKWSDQGSYEQLHTDKRTDALRWSIIWRNAWSLILIYALFRYFKSRVESWFPESLLFVDLSIWLFLLASITYSAHPIRFKARPFLDGLSNILYILPWLTGFFLTWGTIAEFSLIGFIAAWARAVAMHTFSAVPDIEADRAAGVDTTATHIGYRNTLLYCAWVWTVSMLCAIVALPEFLTVWLLLWALYVALSFTALRIGAFTVYKRMPWINALVGFGLFRLFVMGV